MDNIDNIKEELKLVRDELFQLRFKQRVSRDEYTLTKLKEEEAVILKKFKKLTSQIVSYESKGGRKK